MSLGAWGDGGEQDGWGYTEERVEEMIAEALAEALAELRPAVGNLKLLLARARCGLSSVTVGVLLAEEMTRLERAVKLLEPKA